MKELLGGAEGQFKGEIPDARFASKAHFDKNRISRIMNHSDRKEKTVNFSCIKSCRKRKKHH
jgi:hypothetical protein